jgi:hypothetical protein
VVQATGPSDYQDAFAASAELIEPAVLTAEPMSSTLGDGVCPDGARLTADADEGPHETRVKFMATGDVNLVRRRAPPRPRVCASKWVAVKKDRR